VHVDARRTYWSGGPPAGGAFPGSGTVDAVDYRTTDATSDACNMWLGGGSVHATSGSELPAPGFGLEEHRQELVRVRLLAEATLGAPESAGHVAELAALQRADYLDMLGERAATLGVLARVRQRLDGNPISSELRTAAETALEAEVTDAMEREDYIVAWDLIDGYGPRVQGVGPSRSLAVIRGYLEAHRGRRVEAAALVEGVALETEDASARRALLELATALGEEHGFTRAGRREMGPPHVASTTRVSPGIVVAPNPIAGDATIRIVLHDASHVRLDVLDALGRVVAQVADGAHDAGAHAYPLSLSEAPAGMYVVRLVVETAGVRHVHLARATVLR
jgi:hypothetical protein